MNMCEAFCKSKVVLLYHFILDMGSGKGGMINRDASLKECLCISLQNILDMDNLVDVYHNSFDTSMCLLINL